MSLILKHLKTLEVSAASGIIESGGWFYVIADDELSLLKFKTDLKSPIEPVPLLGGELPSDPKTRKKQKPDFEALVELRPGGPILVLPSGSKPNRMLGVLVDQSQVTQVDCTNLYSELLNVFPELNIEGAVVQENELLLFQRGNGSFRQNGIITLFLDLVLSDLQNGTLTKTSFSKITPVALGELNGVPLSFTDAAVEATDKIWFVAAAEATQDTYNDGEFAGAILGVVNSNGEVLFREELLCTAKPEGLCLDLKSNRFFVVTDADDLAMKSSLFAGELPDLSRRPATR